MTDRYSEKYGNWFDQNKKHILDEFFTYLKFESISADPEKKTEVIKCSQWVEKTLKSIGFETQVWDTKVNPAIFGEIIIDPSYPTILFYNHYDVQPVDPLELWESPPFEPRVDGDLIYARGACDDKGLNVYTLFGIKSFLELTKTQKVNIKIIIEGEEEVGSEGFSKVLPQKKKELNADYLVVVDIGVPSMQEPCISLGCRGITTLDMVCEGSKSDLHSGIFGGVAYNPLRALSEVIAKLWDKDGKVAIDGFYDGVESFDSSVLFEPDLQKEIELVGINSLYNEKGFSTFESSTIRPTIEVNGLSGGYFGPGFKTVIPARATCKISCRLVPGQDPDTVGNLVAEFFKKNIAKGMNLEIELGHGGSACHTPADAKIAEVFKSAYEDVFEKSCGLVVSGGSVPIMKDLKQASSAELLGVGLGLSSDNIHAPNEHFGIERLKKGMMTIATALEILANKGA